MSIRFFECYTVGVLWPVGAMLYFSEKVKILWLCISIKKKFDYDQFKSTIYRQMKYFGPT
jgi:hypothetical protein